MVDLAKVNVANAVQVVVRSRSVRSSIRVATRIGECTRREQCEKYERASRIVNRATHHTRRDEEVMRCASTAFPIGRRTKAMGTRSD
jgi:hypothetical protein